jgi:hypothetical protein
LVFPLSDFLLVFFKPSAIIAPVEFLVNMNLFQQGGMSLVSMHNDKVTFSYKPRKKSWTTMTLPALSFMQPFLQHVLPKGFQNVRYCGFLHPSAKKRFNALKVQLGQNATEANDKPASQESTEQEEEANTKHTPEQPGICPNCGGPLRYIGRVARCRTIELPLQKQRSPPCEK